MVESIRPKSTMPLRTVMQCRFETMPWANILCFDSLHHMHDYDAAFSEFHRTLRPGGRCIFVEPGARHSTSPETIAFVEAQKTHDPTWIERNVVLKEIDEISRRAGFSDGIQVVPVPLMLPAVIESHSVDQWERFRAGPCDTRDAHCDALATINYWDRIIFYADKC
jgi:SAM-dependent methyltransferase